MTMTIIREIAKGDEAEALRMRAVLWPDTIGHEQEVAAYIAGTPIDPMGAAMFVCERPGGGLCGFAEVSLRSVAAGCDRHSPVGYLEGWYVNAGFRRQGIAARLLEAVEPWARARGCRDFGSDSLIENELGQRAHLAAGFAEVERAVLFRKPLR